MQLGMLLGFAITPWLVENHENAEDIAADLNRLNYLHLGVTLFQLVLVVSGGFHIKTIFFNNSL